MAGNPMRKAVLMAAGLWPPPKDMSRKQALRLAMERLGEDAGTPVSGVKLAALKARTSRFAPHGRARARDQHR